MSQFSSYYDALAMFLLTFILATLEGNSHLEIDCMQAMVAYCKSTNFRKRKTFVSVKIRHFVSSKLSLSVDEVQNCTHDTSHGRSSRRDRESYSTNVLHYDTQLTAGSLAFRAPLVRAPTCDSAWRKERFRCVGV